LPQLLAKAVALVALACSSGVSGCRAEPGRPYACTCSWLTDYDDEGKVEVVACAPNAEVAPALAKNCAAAAPAPISRCDCQLVSGGPACNQECLE
jgi:hypothetical protein